jgi:hypothetical protein
MWLLIKAKRTSWRKYVGRAIALLLNIMEKTLKQLERTINSYSIDSEELIAKHLIEISIDALIDVVHSNYDDPCFTMDMF